MSLLGYITEVIGVKWHHICNLFSKGSGKKYIHAHISNDKANEAKYLNNIDKSGIGYVSSLYRLANFSLILKSYQNKKITKYSVM